VYVTVKLLLRDSEGDIDRVVEAERLVVGVAEGVVDADDSLDEDCDDDNELEADLSTVID
jgi:hypothetical protein